VETKGSMTNWREIKREMFNLYTCNRYSAVEKDKKWILRVINFWRLLESSNPQKNSSLITHFYCVRKVSANRMLLTIQKIKFILSPLFQVCGFALGYSFQLVSSGCAVFLLWTSCLFVQEMEILISSRGMWHLVLFQCTTCPLHWRQTY